VLVGDSVGMVVLGYSTTQPVTMDDMIHHCKAVRRGAPTRFIVADMPFGSYESSAQDALQNAYRFIKECGADAIKLEGGSASRVETVRKLVDSGVAVMGHVGLTPQGISILGGFRAQGRTAVKARTIVDEALALQDAGAFALVVECVPSPVAKALTEAVKIPVIGIGAGPYTTGQVLVYHDLLGIMNHPHHEKHVPSFCKKYADLGPQINTALTTFISEVQGGTFPSEATHSPYKMSEAEQRQFEELMRIDAEARAAVATKVDTKLKNADEYEAVKLY
jgi:3-methyl-2-oxobutanoate hydroxymethyltransferase